MMLNQINWDVVIVGAGASGLMCAATAGYQGKRVLVLDHAPKAASKIRISGGGKCNFTNLNVTPANYICRNPHFVKSALSRYSAHAFIELVDRHGLEYEQRELGKLFCLHRASDLIQILRTECDWAGVTVQLKTQIGKVVALAENGFELQTSLGALVTQKLVIATGALSFPKLKASGWGYEIARQFGLNIIPTAPGLVPLLFEGKWQQRFAQLSGLSIEAEVSVGEHHFAENILFTHFGLSGPGILQASNYWQSGKPIEINLFPGKSDEALLAELLAVKQSGKTAQSWLNQAFPKRFTQMWLQLYPLEGRLADYPNETLKSWLHHLCHWRLYPADTAGYDKAEVTLGGVDTDEISSKTFEAKKQAGLYFIGEVLDVTGQLGGYNFQWAWASAVACGLAL
ncbi:NAD(P)/FAD-dependent oxidoreductase [Thiomicrorhabdus sp. zzn3]|uniref:NAD(P)/FAD-dependent oxidoreductase n=1 Tax=Thiomicrorhabdus sp. zzn3 TaxID=3039775 RepID=UPI0024373E5A|nr:NAD(P)/FAD-dependent oxidoreductase [Thiomicrorhabdus sp. zzn3]MDG6778874.1 NAD(P)/FAD-dependent oxidoreductase [Thiomicrorhabdus sp. zzn3]